MVLGDHGERIEWGVTAHRLRTAAPEGWDIEGIVSWIACFRTVLKAN